MPEGKEPYRPRVLVVEDNVVIADDLVEILADCGCEACAICATVQEALHSVEAQSADIAIIDYLLEDGSAELVAASLDTKAIPFAILTGHPVQVFVHSDFD